MVDQRRTLDTSWTTNRIIALVLGVVFTVLGIIGFFVAPTMGMGTLFGLEVDLVHNLVHLVTGVLGLIAAFSGYSRRYNQVFGIIYLVIGILGLINPGLYFGGRFLGIMHINGVDNIFHLVVGVVAAGVGFFVTDYENRRATNPTPTY